MDRSLTVKQVNGKDYELQIRFQKSDMVKKITKNRLIWRGGHSWCKQRSLVRQVMEEEPIGKRPLG